MTCYQDECVTLYNDDCINTLKQLPENSIDSVVTDPPYGLSDHKQGDVEACLQAWMEGKPFVKKQGGFMSKNWDSWVPGPEIWKEVYRVMKPGAFIACFASTRTSDLMSMSLRLAGFRKNTDVYYVFGSGFPKATNAGKMIDKVQGNEREFVRLAKGAGAGMSDTLVAIQKGLRPEYELTKGNSKWEGWFYGLQALKPAVEPILLFQKPYEGKAIESILKYDCGALNIDGCRIGTEGGTSKEVDKNIKSNMNSMGGGQFYNGGVNQENYGRWPANLIHDNSEEVLECFPNTGNGHKSKKDDKRYKAEKYADIESGYFGNRGPENSYADSGSAARYFKNCPDDDIEDQEMRRIFYTSKASKKDRDEGCDGMVERHTSTLNEYVNPSEGRTAAKDGGLKRNFHPTVKGTSLMRYLNRLVTPKNGTILDPFMGSGSTGKAALLENFKFIGIEMDAEYCEIAKNRILFAKEKVCSQ
jgi:DNA modification methylase